MQTMRKCSFILDKRVVRYMRLGDAYVLNVTRCKEWLIGCSLRTSRVKDSLNSLHMLVVNGMKVLLQTPLFFHLSWLLGERHEQWTLSVTLYCFDLSTLMVRWSTWTVVSLEKATKAFLICFLFLFPGKANTYLQRFRYDVIIAHYILSGSLFVK